MAIYHLHAQIIGRSAGRSACAAAAYRSTTRIEDRTTGEIFDYTRKTKALASGIIAPENSPQWGKDREALWNAVEEKENRKNSQFAHEYDIALPHELQDQEKERIVREFCQEHFASRELVADYAIHAPGREGDSRNYHVHIMATTRKIDINQLDGWGEKDREANGKDFLNSLREGWEKIVNREMERIGSYERISCKTLEEQGADREPQQHQGSAATALKRRGGNPERTKTPLKGFFEKTAEQEIHDPAEIEKLDQEIFSVLRDLDDIQKDREELRRDREKTAKTPDQEMPLLGQDTKAGISEFLEKGAVRQEVKISKPEQAPGPEKVKSLIHASPEIWRKEKRQFEQKENAASAAAFSKIMQDRSSEIQKIYENEIRRIVKKQTELNRRIPEKTAEKVRGPRGLFTDYRTSDGRVFSKYDDYRKEQERLIAAYRKETQNNRREQTGVEEKLQRLKAARGVLDYMRAGADLQENHRKVFFEIRNSVPARLDADPEFAAFRRERAAFREAAAAREKIAAQERVQRGREEGDRGRGRSR